MPRIAIVEDDPVCTRQIQDMEEQLTGLPFVRCSHSYLVNLANVSGVKRDALLVGGQEIPVSRPRSELATLTAER